MKKLFVLLILMFMIFTTACDFDKGVPSATIKDQITEKSIAVKADVEWVNQEGFLCEFKTDKTFDLFEKELSEKNENFFVTKHNYDDEKYLCIQTYSQDVPFLIVSKLKNIENTYHIESEVEYFSPSDDFLVNWLFELNDDSKNCRIYYPLHFTKYQKYYNNNQTTWETPNPFIQEIKLSTKHHIISDFYSFYINTGKYDVEVVDSNESPEKTGKKLYKVISVKDRECEFEFYIDFYVNTDNNEWTFKYRW